MISGMLLETCWAFHKVWNNKFYYKVKLLRWSRGSVLAFGTQVRGVRTRPKPSGFLGQKKILSTASFGGVVKPSVPWRSFTAYKRSLYVTWKSAFRQNSRTFLAHSSTFRQVGRPETSISTNLRCVTSQKRSHSNRDGSLNINQLLRCFSVFKDYRSQLAGTTSNW